MANIDVGHKQNHQTPLVRSGIESEFGVALRLAGEQSVADPNCRHNQDGSQKSGKTETVQHAQLSTATRKLVRNVGFRAFTAQRAVVQRPVDGQRGNRAPHRSPQTATPNAENDQRKRSKSSVDVDAGDGLECLETGERSGLRAIERAKKHQSRPDGQRRGQLRSRQDMLRQVRRQQNHQHRDDAPGNERC